MVLCITAIALGIIILLLLFSLSYKQQLVIAATVDQSIHQRLFINLPSSYSNQKIFLDGEDNDWNGIKKIGYSGISTHQLYFGNPLVGSMMVRNNESHLAIFMDLKTPYPVQDPFRRIMLPFDENSDGRWTTGDTEKIITAIGPGKPLHLLIIFLTIKVILSRLHFPIPKDLGHL
jgi:hypothetical protein